MTSNRTVLASFVSAFLFLTGCAAEVGDGSDTTPPTTPGNVTITGTTSTSISIAWSPSSDDRGVAGYGIYRDTQPWDGTLSTSFTDTGLAPGSYHCYAVQAFDAAENPSALSQPACGTTSTAAEKVLTVARTGTGTGTVTGTSISCGTSCSASYATGSPVTLTATPGAGSTFTSWTGCDSTSGNTCTVTMSADRTVTASFTATTPASYTLTVSRSGTGTGTVTGTGISCGATCGATYLSGTSVTLLATPQAGSTFTSWTGCDSTSGNTCSITMTGSRSVDATFDLVPICTPTATRCVAGNVGVQETCNGTAWIQESCGSWELCTSGACHPVCESQRFGPFLNPAVCFVPNADGVNDGTLAYTSSPTLLGSTTATGGASARVSPYAPAPIYASDRGWPYAWRLTGADEAYIDFKLGQFGSLRTVYFDYGARKASAGHSTYAYGRASNGSSTFWQSGDLLFTTWYDGWWGFESTLRPQWDYTGGWNSISLVPTGPVAGDPVDPVDIDYVAIEVAP